MGTIVDKFNYSFEAKDLIKDSINNLGGSITSETELKEYAEELDNIYDNLPKTTGEGTNLSLTTLKGRMNIIPKGNIEQETTNGYQLFQGISYSNTTSGITFNYDINGGIKAVGTATANAYSMTTGNSSPYRFNLASGNYIVSGGSDNVRIQVINSSGTTLANDTGSNATFTLSETTSVYLRIEVRNGTNVNATYYPMLESGTTAHTWEKFTGGTASPNPTYPQNIEVVTGTQEVKVENVNLCKNAIVNATSGAYVDILYVDMDLKPNTTYTISFIGTTNNKIYLNENITTPQYITCTGNRQSLTFTTKSSLDKNNSQQYKTSVGGWITFKNQSANAETPNFVDVQVEKRKHCYII